MLHNYLKIAWRNLVRHKLFSFINVVGLAIGLACCLTIVLFVRDELQYDTFHVNADQIYRLVNRRSSEGRQNELAVTPPAYGPTLKAHFPEVQQTARLFAMNAPVVSYQNNKFQESGFLLADSTVLDVFSFPLIRGNAQTALNEPHTIVLSETMARKYFGGEEPLNKTIKVANSIQFRVTGVMKDLPTNSHLKINFIGSFSTLKEFVGADRLKNWHWQQFYTYVVLPKGYDHARLEAKLPAFLEEYAKADLSELGIQYQTRLQPLNDIHLRSAGLEYDIAEKGDIRFVYAFTVTALFALLIACFNFMNLSTARSTLRAKEVGLRKAIGSGRGQLITQFLGESVLLTVIALVLALGMTKGALLLFDHWFDRPLSMSTIFAPSFLLVLVAGTVLIGLLAGSYPAFFLSGFRPLNVLKGNLKIGGSGAFRLRKTLIVLQFAIAAFLIAGAGIVFTQLRYIQQKNLGFVKDQLIMLPLHGEAMIKRYEALKEELKQNPNILEATACYGVPGGLFAGDGIRLPGRDKEFTTNMFLIDADYIPTLGMKMAAGRNFSKQFGTDESTGFIINETAVKELGWQTPAKAIGKEMYWEKWSKATPTEDSLKRGKVIGVVQDFNYKSLHQKIEPLVLHIASADFSSIVIKTRAENVATTLDFLKSKWQAAATDWPFEYTFIDEQFASLHRSEQRFGKLFALFTGLSIFIACLGLFGLATFMAEQRTKEIGIRKVLGASVAGIVALLAQDFLKLVLIALVIAFPLTWYAMRQWLQDFAYKIDMSWWIFVLAGLLSVGIALLTVSFQSVKAALMNPVKSLKTE